MNVTAILTALALLLIGYSLISAATLVLTHCRKHSSLDPALDRVTGFMLLVALCTLQASHFLWLHFDWEQAFGVLWRLALFGVAPAFYLFCRPLLLPSTPRLPAPLLFAHALPLLLAPLLSNTIALPLAFSVGTGYLVWLARSLYPLRNARAHFRLEITLLGTAVMIATGAAVLGVAQWRLPSTVFFSLHAIAIGLAFLLVNITLHARPSLPTEINEVARGAYHATTLTKVDCPAAFSRLESLMAQDRLYQDPSLNLSALAAKIELSTHRLSELLNSRLGKSFSRYLREQRISAAKTMLIEEPAASVLSVGLSVGFTSQSNFYDAFREIEGMTPGHYRKLHAPAPS